MHFPRCPRLLSNLKCVLCIILGALIFNEYAIYYVVQYKCDWPVLKDGGSRKDDQLKALFIADTHLLGPFRGHWFDKLRREWQMHRAYTTAVSLTPPDVVFFLGDIFDEGQWVDDIQFGEYVDRFRRLFPPREGCQQQIVVGNHDIGFHYVTTSNLVTRFDRAFSGASTELTTVKNISFVLVNSIAMEDDGCHLCEAAKKKLNLISRQLKDRKQRPVLLQHFPLYRKSDGSCDGEDAAPENEKYNSFRPKWDCLSESSSQWLLGKIKPRLVLSGHTHHGCIYKHGDIAEYSVPSFSWRNRNNPSYLLVQFTEDEFAISKCFIPQESSVFLIYQMAGWFALISFLWRYRRVFYWHRNRCKTS